MEPPKITIKLKTLDSKIIEVQATLDDSVEEFRQHVANALQTGIETVRLIYRGKVLKDGTQLKSYGIEDGHAVHLVQRQPGSAASSLDSAAPSSAPSSASSSSSSVPSPNPAMPAAAAHGFPQATATILGPFNGTGMPMDLSSIFGSFAMGGAGGVPPQQAGSSSFTFTLPGGQPAVATAMTLAVDPMTGVASIVSPEQMQQLFPHMQQQQQPRQRSGSASSPSGQSPAPHPPAQPQQHPHIHGHHVHHIHHPFPMASSSPSPPQQAPGIASPAPSEQQYASTINQLTSLRQSTAQLHASFASSASLLPSFSSLFNLLRSGTAQPAQIAAALPFLLAELQGAETTIRDTLAALNQLSQSVGGGSSSPSSSSSSSSSSSAAAPSAAPASSSLPVVNNITLHVHANVADMDRLPAQLARLGEQINYVPTRGTSEPVQQQPGSLQRRLHQAAQIATAHQAQPAAAPASAPAAPSAPSAPAPARPSSAPSAPAQGAAQAAAHPLGQMMQGVMGMLGGGQQQGGGLNLASLAQSALGAMAQPPSAAGAAPAAAPASRPNPMAAAMGMLPQLLSGGNGQSILSLANQLGSAMGIPASAGSSSGAAGASVDRPSLRNENGFDDSRSDAVINLLIETASSQLQVQDMMALISGAGSPVERFRQPLRAALAETVLNNVEPTHGRRLALSRRLIQEVEEVARYILSTSRSPANAEADRSIMHRVREYLAVPALRFVNTMLDAPHIGYEQLMKTTLTAMIIAIVRGLISSPERQIDVIQLSQGFVSWTARGVMASLTEQLGPLLGMATSIFTQKFAPFIQAHQNDSELVPSPTESEILASEPNADFFASSRVAASPAASVPSAASSAPVSAASVPAQASVEEERKEEQEEGDEVEPLVAAQVSSQPQRAPAPVRAEEENEEWEQGLSPSERSVIRRTLASDARAEVHAREDRNHELSDAYISGNPSEEKKRKDKAASSSASSPSSSSAALSSPSSSSSGTLGSQVRSYLNRSQQMDEMD